MSEAGQETEVKFYVRRLEEIPPRLHDLGGRLTTPRTLELNYRLDTPEGRLRREGRALRLRRDDSVRLTYKGPSQWRDGARSRPEIETTVGDFSIALQLLESLGYVISFIYEKYRATYNLGQAEIMLDELPFGDFVEIEGPVDVLRECADQLRLDWAAAIPHSYHALFERVHTRLALGFRDLTFAEFGGVIVDPEYLGVWPADH
jgi:adenylate cyclase class 2